MSDHHIVPFSVNLKVFLALIVLTIVTVVTARFMHFGHFNTAVAMFIASVKAVLVFGWFMHLKYEGYLHRIIISTAFIFLILLYSISALDVFTR